jgi:hypothetical protein
VKALTTGSITEWSPNSVESTLWLRSFFLLQQSTTPSDTASYNRYRYTVFDSSPGFWGDSGKMACLTGVMDAHAHALRSQSIGLQPVQVNDGHTCLKKNSVTFSWSLGCKEKFICVYVSCFAAIQFPFWYEHIHTDKGW